MAGSRLALVELGSVTAVISSEFPVQERVDSGQGTLSYRSTSVRGEMRGLGRGYEKEGQ